MNKTYNKISFAFGTYQVVHESDVGAAKGT